MRLDQEEIDRLDGMFGFDQWVTHYGCPMAPPSPTTGETMPYVAHHRRFHER